MQFRGRGNELVRSNSLDSLSVARERVNRPGEREEREKGKERVVTHLPVLISPRVSGGIRSLYYSRICHFPSI